MCNNSPGKHDSDNQYAVPRVDKIDLGGIVTILNIQSAIEPWRSQLGLLPVPLHNDFDEQSSYVLLNGIRGNFCLDLSNIRLGDETRNAAWSANVGHYLSRNGDLIEVQRWDRQKSSFERYTYQSVIDNLEKFHLYLERDVPKQGLSVISHTMKVFRKLRAVLENEVTGPESLKAFLFLLACATRGVDRDDVSLGEWGLDPVAKDIANIVRSLDWESLVNELSLGRRVDGLRPELQLVLRHASGQLFQEAHYETTFVPQEQLRLEGFLPRPVGLQSNDANQGLHFTPPALARTLVEESIGRIPSLTGRNDIVIFDPACGSGEFLRESLRQLKLLGFSGRIKLIGWDISQAACDMARFVLAWESKGMRVAAEVQIERKDSILEAFSWPTNADIIIMNPPFISWQDMNQLQQDALSAMLGASKKNRPDLAFAFLYRAASVLKKDGVLGTLIPSLILNGVSAKPLRELLGEQLSIKLIAKLGSHILFTNATVDASLYIATKNASNHFTPVAFWADHRSDSNSAGLRALRRIRYLKTVDPYPVVGDGFSIYLNPELGTDSEQWSPRPYKAWELTHLLKDSSKVKDTFFVRMGTLTGGNSTFILSKEMWSSLPAKERKYFRPAVMNKSVNAGQLTDGWYVFYPYGNFTISTEQELEKQLPNYYRNFLYPQKERLYERPSLRGSAWWELSEHRAWQRERYPKLVSTYFGDVGSFAWDESGEFVVVQGMGWLPKGLRERKPSRDVQLAYLCVLNSEFFSFLLSSTSNQVRGGQWNLSPRFVNNTPMPKLFDLDYYQISELASIGELYFEGKAREIDKKRQEVLVRSIYGVD